MPRLFIFSTLSLSETLQNFKKEKIMNLVLLFKIYKEKELKSMIKCYTYSEIFFLN